MSKYIDADKLIAELTRMQFDLNAAYRHPQSDSIVRAISLEYDDILSLVDSLQQEQPESICPRCAYHNKTDDFCEYPYGGRKCSINENGVYECNGFEVVEQQEQPEVDLEKEVQRWENKHGVVGMDDLWLKFAHHFYELGRNAKKEK